MTDIVSVRVVLSDSFHVYYDITFASHLNRGDKYSISNYDHTLMCYVNDFLPQRIGIKRNRLLIRCESRYAMLSNDYFAILTCNDRAVAKLSYNLSADNSVSNLTTTTLTHAMMESIVVEQLSRKEFYQLEWDKLGDYPGITPIKQRAIELFRWKMFNERRYIMNLKDVRPCLNFTVSSDDAQYLTNPLQNFAKIVDMTWNVIDVDLSSVIEEGNGSNLFQTADKYFESNQTFYILHHFGSLLWGAGASLAKMIESRMTVNGDIGFIFVGTKAEITLLGEKYPTLIAKIDEQNHLELQSMDVKEFLSGVQCELRKMDLRLSSDALNELNIGLLLRSLQNTLPKLSLSMLSRFVTKGLAERFVKRVANTDSVVEPQSAMQLQMIDSRDIDWSMFETASLSVDDVMHSLSNMVGLTSVKKVVADMASLERYARLCQQQGINISRVSNHHMIFTGNPGTGKTTVAKKIGQLFHSLGVLSKGDVITAERGTIVGRYLGDTENNMQNLFAQAKGNVLFIDEAYSLNTGAGDKADFGNRVIECLLTVLAQPNPDMIIIMAGYQNEMDKMLDSNPGLRGRFTHYLHFEDYSSEELQEIAQMRIASRGLKLSLSATEALADAIGKTLRDKTNGFANARWVEQFADKAICHTANRVLASHLFTQDYLVTITSEDIEAAYNELTIGNNYAKPKIGFA